MLVAGERGIPCFSYTPQRVKSSVCGHGRAGKDQVGRMVQTLLGLPTIPAKDHASDALAVAICHLNGTPLTDAVTRATRRSVAAPGAQGTPLAAAIAKATSRSVAASGAQVSLRAAALARLAQ